MKMFGLRFFLIVSTLAHSGLCSVRGRPDSATTGLKFGLTVKDYVLFKPAMEPLRESFSVCAWIKRYQSKDHTDNRFWLSYGISSNHNELILASAGHYGIFGSEESMKDKMNAESDIGQWRHQCVTWSYSSKQLRVFHEGNLIGVKDTPSGRKLGMGGYMVLGNEFDSYGGGFVESQAFGGELFKANVFAKELTEDEIKEMYSGGLCSDVEEKYGRTRYLKWSDFLLEDRTGDVTEVDVGCVVGACRWDILEDFVGVPITERFIRHLKFYHGRSHDNYAPDIENSPDIDLE